MSVLIARRWRWVERKCRRKNFNDRNPTIVPQLADDEFAVEKCTVYFPLPWDDNASTKMASVVKDDGDRQDMTAKALLSVLYDMRDATSSITDDDDDDHHLCAVAGSLSNLPARTASTLAAASSIPYLSHGADTTKISRPPLYPLSGKTTADEYARGDALLSYLSSLDRNHVTLVYSHTNEDVLKVTSKAARDHNVELRYEPVSPPWDGTGANSPYDAMRRIQDSGFKTIVLALPRLSHWEHIAREAERWGVNGDDYLWMVWDNTDIDVLSQTETSEGSEMDKLVRGMGAVRVLDGYDWMGADEENKFLARWKSKDAAFVERLNEINPITADEAGYFFAEDNYFQDERYPPMPSSTFMYDTGIALGMGACRTQKILRDLEETNADDEVENNDVNNEVDGSGTGSRRRELAKIPTWSTDFEEAEVDRDGSSRRLQSGYVHKPGKNLQYNETVKVTFNGASGFVKLDDGFIFTRDDDTIGFGVYNFRPIQVVASEDDAADIYTARSYKYALTAKKTPGNGWEQLPDSPFIYADGTTSQPWPARQVFENNYLSSSVRAGGFALFGIAAFICIGLALWTFTNRKTSTVRLAQPEFLYTLCIGSLVSLASIITLSFDESYGTSVETLSMLCTATPWFFVSGYIISFMSIFSKLDRLNSVLQFRRRQVKAHHVIAPAIALTLLAIIILAVWTAVDPWTWERETINDDTGETFGNCTSENITAYLIPLVVLMITATLLACAMAWKTRDVSSKYSETTSIFFAIIFQVEIWFVGIPILIIVDNVSADATYLGRVLIIWTFAVSMVATVVGSKMLQSLGSCLPSSRNTSRLSGGSSTVHVSGIKPNLRMSSSYGKGRSSASSGSGNGNNNGEKSRQSVTFSGVDDGESGKSDTFAEYDSSGRTVLPKKVSSYEESSMRGPSPPPSEENDDQNAV